MILLFHQVILYLSEIIFDDKITDENLQHYKTREAKKISVILSGNLDKYEYFIDEKILPSDQSRMLKKVKFTCYPLGKDLENQIKLLKNKKENKYMLSSNKMKKK